MARQRTRRVRILVCLTPLCIALPNPAEGQLDRVSMWLPKGQLCSYVGFCGEGGRTSDQKGPKSRVPSIWHQDPVRCELSLTPGALLFFQSLKAPCHERPQLTLNKPAFYRLPLPGPLSRGPMAQSVSKNTRLGQTRAGMLALWTGSPLAVLQRANFGSPGIQFPSLEWAPSWLPLTSGPTPPERG